MPKRKVDDYFKCYGIRGVNDAAVKLKHNSGDALAALACGWPLKKTSFRTQSKVSAAVFVFRRSHMCAVFRMERAN